MFLKLKLVLFREVLCCGEKQPRKRELVKQSLEEVGKKNGSGIGPILSDFYLNETAATSCLSVCLSLCNQLQLQNEDFLDFLL